MYENNIFVDPVRRAESPEAADDTSRRRGQRPKDACSAIGRCGISPEAETTTEDLDAELYGTTDVGHAIEEGTPWIPPEAPTPEGYPGQEERGEFGEDH